MYKKYEILELLVSFCRFVNLQIVITKNLLEKDDGQGSFENKTKATKTTGQRE
jgi:hypothetical protein